MFCIAEGMRRLDREFVSPQRLQSLAIMRDESDARLVVRFCARNEKLETRNATLGLAKNFGSGGKCIHNATQEMLKAFCTTNHGVLNPKGDVAQTLDSKLHRAMRDKLHQISIDAASDEVLAARIAGHGIKLDGIDVLAPNLKSINRDKTHGCRRTAPPLCKQFVGTDPPHCRFPWSTGEAMCYILYASCTARSSLHRRCACCD